MWKVTLLVCSGLMFIFWFITEITVSPVYNLILQYFEEEAALPIITQWAINARPYMVIMPVLWLVVSILLYVKLQSYAKPDRNERVTAHLAITLGIGFVMLGFFALAIVLALLKVSAITA
ncbi:MAG: hypothetical protein ABW092_18555 [Candidatus Thiodiazotropha sp.]